jgi:hypothetical protein
MYINSLKVMCQTLLCAVCIGYNYIMTIYVFAGMLLLLAAVVMASFLSLTP